MKHGKMNNKRVAKQEKVIKVSEKRKGGEEWLI